MDPREIVLEQIRHRETGTVPYTLGFEGDVAARLDGHYGGKAWRERLTRYISYCGGIPTMNKEPVDRKGDEEGDEEGDEGEADPRERRVLERDLFGSLWRTDKRPFHLERPGLAEASFEGYAFPDAGAFAVPDLAERAAERKRAEPGCFTLVNIPWGLWESSWGIRGFENALVDMIASPDFYAELLDRLTDLFMAHVAQCEGVEVDAVMFGDDWGDQRGVIVGPDRWRELFKPRYARLYEAVHAQGKLVISHCCGSVVDIMPDIVEIGLDVLESVQPEARGMDPYGLKKSWGERITFWGCLGSQSTIPFGTPEGIRAEVARLKREMARGGGFILSPAKSLQPETPTENAVAVLEAFTCAP